MISRSEAVSDPMFSPTEDDDPVTASTEFPFRLQEAQRLRQQLMEDRTWLQAAGERELEKVEWNFCEH
jgi:hypothetical protein